MTVEKVGGLPGRCAQSLVEGIAVRCEGGFDCVELVADLRRKAVGVRADLLRQGVAFMQHRDFKHARAFAERVADAVAMRSDCGDRLIGDFAEASAKAVRVVFEALRNEGVMVLQADNQSLACGVEGCLRGLGVFAEGSGDSVACGQQSIAGAGCRLVDVERALVQHLCNALRCAAEAVVHRAEGGLDRLGALGQRARDFVAGFRQRILRALHRVGDLRAAFKEASVNLVRCCNKLIARQPDGIVECDGAVSQQRRELVAGFGHLCVGAFMQGARMLQTFVQSCGD